MGDAPHDGSIGRRGMMKRQMSKDEWQAAKMMSRSGPWLCGWMDGWDSALKITLHYIAKKETNMKEANMEEWDRG